MRREGIRLSTGEKARIDFDLSVGDIREQVTVVADAPVVRVETASLGTVVENEQVVQLPLNGRLFTNEYLFDGISVLQPEPGQLAYYPIIDAVQEFKIESNSPPAEFGRFNGGVVNLTTKPGTNAFHGNLFEFFCNEHLNARNYFQATNPVKPDCAVAPRALPAPDKHRHRGRAKHPGGVVGALVNDWSAATFMTMQPGVPVAVTQANSLGYAGFTTQRPNLVGDPTLPGDERTPARWFNTAAFATANQFTIGSASRNPVRGPAYRNVDLAVMRKVRFGGERAIELRFGGVQPAEYCEFRSTGGATRAASFGTITTALDPRVVQLAANILVLITTNGIQE
jgi:hypothetical protein